MARIRTIKPEFPQSESMGRVSREARLCFVLLWTVADDSGRLRGNSRMLASLLYPYDDDAGRLIDGWLAELEREGCIRRYQVEGSSYLEIAKWLSHQKIDKPSASKLPPFDEHSASPREASRILPVGMEGNGMDLDTSAGPTRQPEIPPPVDAIVELFHELLPDLPRVRLMGDKRKRALGAWWRWILTSKRPDGTRRATNGDEALGWVRDYFTLASANDFINGRTRKTGEHENWRADIDWIITERGMRHVIEKTQEAA